MTAERFDPDSIGFEKLRALYDYWNSKRREGALPRRRDIDPVEIPHLLPIIYLLGVEHDPRRFRFRLVGTDIIRWFGRDATGLYMDEPNYGRAVEAIQPHYEAVVETGEPRCDPHLSPQLDARYRNYTRLICPLTVGSSRVDMLLCGLQIQKS